MKISIVIQYYNRRSHLLKSLCSISKSVLSKDAEIVIIDDASDKDQSIDNICDFFPDLNIVLFKFTKEEKWWSCPVITINKGISLCTGELIIIQCAEIYHNGDILLDAKNRIQKNDYLVYGCNALTEHESNNLSNPNVEKKGWIWYQHSVNNNRCYNFCTAILKSDLMELGGFDERYANGISYGDDDFILRVRRKGMNVISIDEPYTYHLHHESMQFQPQTDKIHDEELYKHVLNNETGYFVKNSFL